MKIFAVGLGPGNSTLMAPMAASAIEQSDVIVGYTSYMELIPELLAGKRTISTGMRGEVERCQEAIDEALLGNTVAVVCSGDSGIYGMAGLLFQLAEAYPEIEIVVVPGITAAIAAAALLGSPLTNDFAVISLSDHLTPWTTIKSRLEAVSQTDMVICLYNPQSKTRSDYLSRACKIMLRHKPADTACGYVRNAFRGDDSTIKLCLLGELADEPVDMLTTVIIGNSFTSVINNKLVTARGYQV
ncbi:MAG: precorrin-3B C(17)-methyltransferase [Coriobacteriia bacterium]|nr:precorrin-3B C(17)-methyltransferase [Coriobacteriia bacterium]